MVAGITTSLLFSLAMLGSTFAAPSLVERAESHKVEFVNRCGAGTPVFIMQGPDIEHPAGVTTGPLLGGIAYLKNYMDCGRNGINCGVVEFSLVNPSNLAPNNLPMQNSIDYSLLTALDKIKGDSLGDHKYKYPMNVQYTGNAPACKLSPGRCVGESAALCAGSYLKSETEGGSPSNCLGDNAGVRITFC